MKAGVDVEMTTRVKRAVVFSQYVQVACISIGTRHTSRRIDKEHVESTTNESGQLNGSADSDTCQTLTPRLHRCGRYHYGKT
jgi:hypothetical protein